MEVNDLTKYYLQYLKDGDLKRYEETYPAFFEHYFTFWGERKSFKKTLNEKEVNEQVRLIKKELPTIEAALKKYHFDTDDIKLVLFVGQGSSNGHAFLDNNTFVVWISIELYTSALQVRSFVTHEIIHAIHYRHNPGLYFSTSKEKYDPHRQLITEGVATYVTKKIMGLSDTGALWADVLPGGEAQKWLDECKKSKEALCGKIQKNEGSQGLFEANDPSNIYSFRAGYYLGRLLIEKIAEDNDMSEHEVITLPHDTITDLIQKELKKCA